MEDEPGQPLPEELVAAVNERSVNLIDEFSRHFHDVSNDLRGLSPELVANEGGIDRHKIFEGWAIQKIAALQLLVENLCDRMDEVEGG